MRPLLNSGISPQDFSDFYWLKKELVNFCRAEGLKTTGGKMEIANRIKAYLDNGNKQATKTKTSLKPTSKFDWKTEVLSLGTLITDNYKNTQNVRNLFTEKIGKQFKFNVVFMDWMKSNEGKTLREAVEEWKRIEQARKMNTQAKEIAPQFEFNRYLRDFLADNPNVSRKKGIESWNKKKAKRGNNNYHPSDLK